MTVVLCLALAALAAGAGWCLLGTDGREVARWMLVAAMRLFN